jgi:hypothetical protein
LSAGTARSRDDRERRGCAAATRGRLSSAAVAAVGRGGSRHSDGGRARAGAMALERMLRPMLLLPLLIRTARMLSASHGRAPGDEC